MRSPGRIPIIIENINWFDFLKYLSERFNSFTLEDSRMIADEIISYGSDKVKEKWEAGSDQRLTQLLINEGLLCDGAHYFFEETEYFITQRILKPEEILFWGSHGKDGKGPLRYIKLLDMETDHLEACLRTQPNMNNLYKKTMQKLLRQRKLKKLNGNN